jgi:prevent-host-death family protein
MITVGAFDAKTHLSTLLERVASGEHVVITKHGKPVARLIPESAAKRADMDDTIARLKAARDGIRLGDIPWKDLRDTGRR